MAKKLQQNGIQTLLTRPEDLSINTINKYLEIKARGLL
jgi:N-acetylmuramoyl-L-alanine amidase